MVRAGKSVCRNPALGARNNSMIKVMQTPRSHGSAVKVAKAAGLVNAGSAAPGICGSSAISLCVPIWTEGNDADSVD